MEDLSSVQFRVSRDCCVFICFAGKVTQGAIVKLKEVLTLMQDTYPADLSEEA